jgi:hypothetical protein
MALEGIVSKRADAPYTPGNRGLWVKVKCLHREEFVVVGWTDPEGTRPSRCLLLAYYDPDGRLVYAGRAGTGIKQEELKRLWRRLQPLAIDKMPLEVPAAAQQPLRIALGAQPRALGAARACRRGEISQLGPTTIFCARSSMRVCARTSRRSRYAARCRMVRHHPIQPIGQGLRLLRCRCFERRDFQLIAFDSHVLERVHRS